MLAALYLLLCVSLSRTFLSVMVVVPNLREGRNGRDAGHKLVQDIESVNGPREYLN